MRYRLPDGSFVFDGQYFECGGIGYPGNWLASASDETKQALGFIADPEPAGEPMVNCVSTYRIVKRLEAAGKIEAANALLEQNLASRAKFYTVGYIRADDPEANALLAAIGADPAEILAQE